MRLDVGLFGLATKDSRHSPHVCDSPFPPVAPAHVWCSKGPINGVTSNQPQPRLRTRG